MLKLPYKKKADHDALIQHGGVDSFIQRAQHSMLFQPNCRWDDMLSGAPLTIAVMGAGFVASTASSTSTVTIMPPKGVFKYISTFEGDSGEMALSAALVQIAKKGQNAFELANTNMQGIAGYGNDLISKAVAGQLP